MVIFGTVLPILLNTRKIIKTFFPKFDMATTYSVTFIQFGQISVTEIIIKFLVKIIVNYFFKVNIFDLS